jgi:anti-sigma B factor antagonist
MFTRRVIMNFKPDSAAEAGRIIKGEVIPRLRQQKGMRHDDTFISPKLSEAVLNSYWDAQGYAEAYGRGAYPAALKALSGVLEGTPQVETFDISSSTFPHLTARRREAYGASILRRDGWGAPPQAPRLQRAQENTASLPCRIDERRIGAVTILDLDGELRAGGARVALHDTIGRLLEEGRSQILLNLAGLTAIDASGLGELLQSNAELDKSGGQLKLLRPARALREMMSITKLLDAFDIYENESEAVAGFARPSPDPEGRLLSPERAHSETHS